MAKGHVAAGGLHSRVVKHSKAPKVEPRSRGQNISAVAQLGAHIGDHITAESRPGSTGYRGEELVRGAGYSPPVGPTDNVAACGVGGGRKIYASGSQGTQGSTNPGKPGLPSTKGQWPD
jgi:hypothetical protein